MSNETLLTRRGLFMKLGILFNGVVAASAGRPDRALPALVGHARSRRTPTPRGCRSVASASFRKEKRGWRRSAIRS